ncbi:recombinase family protein [Endozoicomonas gorgoniicola]|uniref:Recombinase family protein n=1 Tax=Endozoicomonas gorgoniicola TaxID=1234144 RepID=A0ABT3N326_9GAMM|nr:recombinase family protein [Endozoicomonas gorgoniicola]
MNRPSLNSLSTEGAMGKMIIQILAAVAEAERERILERTNEGRLAAKESGVKFGRKPHKSTDQAKAMICEGVSMKEVMERTGVSRATYFRLKKVV